MGFGLLPFFKGVLGGLAIQIPIHQILPKSHLHLPTSHQKGDSPKAKQQTVLGIALEGPTTTCSGSDQFQLTLVGPSFRPSRAKSLHPRTLRRLVRLTISTFKGGHLAGSRSPLPRDLQTGHPIFGHFRLTSLCFRCLLFSLTRRARLGGLPRTWPFACSSW